MDSDQHQLEQHQLEQHQELETLSVMGLPVHNTDNYVGWLNRRLSDRKGTHVVTLNAEMCMQAQQNRPLRDFIEKADLVAPDGSGVELYFRLMRGKTLQRYPGIELAADLLQSLGPDYKVAFYGGQPAVVQAAAEQWKVRSPQLNLVIVQHGYAQGDELASFIHQLEQAQPDLIFVGLGVPRQEFWIAEHRHLCPHAIWIGIGGSYDIWSGMKARAPKWMRTIHLEWLYRLYQEPWRWRRMLALPQFVWASFWYRLQKE
ncbi:MAG: WecB/TagA/CpsF family glycosyltransferase [Phormidesmis sp. RL_2_1]|nr:WecB/TagA/CpsF family glycosyltransferase [Phormidesmis sp. RL_2_1]